MNDRTKVLIEYLSKENQELRIKIRNKNAEIHRVRVSIAELKNEIVILKNKYEPDAIIELPRGESIGILA